MDPKNRHTCWIIPGFTKIIPAPSSGLYAFKDFHLNYPIIWLKNSVRQDILSLFISFITKKESFVFNILIKLLTAFAKTIIYSVCFYTKLPFKY